MGLRITELFNYAGRCHSYPEASGADSTQPARVCKMSLSGDA